MGRSKSFVVHGMILGAASIISRIIGLVYRIPLNNILGSEALSDYANAYNIYSFMLMLSSLSVPLAVSKMVSAKVARKEYISAYKIFKNALLFAICVGIVFGLLAFFGASAITGLLNYGEGITPALKCLAPALVVMSVVGVFRGYYQGLGTMIPTAFSNIIEQIANAVVSIVAAVYLIGYGQKLFESGQIGESMVHSYGAAGGTLGTVFGALVALGFLLYTFALYKKRLTKQMKRDYASKDETRGEILKVLILTIIPVIISTTIYNISTLMDSAIFGNFMNFKGMEVATRKVLYGSYSGYYVLLQNVPVSLAAALASSTVPAIVKSFALNDIKGVKAKAGAAIKLSMLVGIPCAIGYFALARPIIMLLFRSCDSVDMVTRMLMLGCASIIFYTLSTVTGSVLQGISKMRVPVINSAISLAIHVVALCLALRFTDLNIYALVLFDMIFSLIICILNLNAIRRYINFVPEVKNTFVMPAVAAAIMGFVGFIVYRLLIKVGIFGNSISCIIAILVCFVVYAILLLLFKTVSEDELEGLPGGRKMVSIARRLHLM